MYAHANTNIEPSIFDNNQVAYGSDTDAFEDDLEVSPSWSDSDAYGPRASDGDSCAYESDPDGDTLSLPQRTRKEPPLAFTNTGWGREYAANPNWTAENLVSEATPVGAMFYQGSRFRFRPEPRGLEPSFLPSDDTPKNAESEIQSSPPVTLGKDYYEYDSGSEHQTSSSFSLPLPSPATESVSSFSDTLTLIPANARYHEYDTSLESLNLPSTSPQTPTPAYQEYDASLESLSLPIFSPQTRDYEYDASLESLNSPSSSPQTPTPAARTCVSPSHTPPPVIRRAQTTRPRREYSVMSAWIPFSHTFSKSYGAVFASGHQEIESRGGMKRDAGLASVDSLAELDLDQMGPWSSLLMRWDDYEQWRLRPRAGGM